MRSVAVDCGFLARPPTGVQRYAWEILRRLGATSDTKYRLLVPRTLGIHPAFEHHSALSFERRVVGAGILWEQLSLRLAARNSAVLWTPSGLGPAGATRQVLTLHDLSPLEHPEWFAPAYRLKYRLLLPRAARCALHIVTSSRFSRDRLHAVLGVPLDRITVVPGAAAISGEGRQGNAAARYGVGDHYVMAVGSLEPRKNLRRLFEAVALVRREHPALRLAVAGKADRIFADAHLPRDTSDFVSLLGYVPDCDLADLYRDARAFVYPSLYEGFGLPPLEAMRCGTPVVASNCTAMPEVLGDAALLVDPFSVEAIAGGIVRLLGDPALAHRLREVGAQRASLYSWEVSAGIVGDLFTNLASAPD